MRQDARSLRTTIRSGAAPALVRFLGKLVVEVLPAALASVIGAFLFAHYQFGQPDAARSGSPAADAAPPPAEMIKLVREEHAMIRDFITAQQIAEKNRATAADAADATALSDAKLVATAAPPAAAVLTAEKPAPKRSRPAVVANGGRDDTPAATAELPTVLIASAQPDPVVMPLAPPAPPPPPAPPAGVSLLSTTLAMPGHVAGVTLHAVTAIGGIPSWIGRRLGAAELDSDAPAF